MHPASPSFFKKRFVLLACIILFYLMLTYLPFEENTVIGLSILAFIASLWLTEAIHISITALLVPVLAALLGVFSTSQALSYFADPIIFLFLGGFALASALSRQKLDKAIAGLVLTAAKGNFKTALFLLFTATAGLSMWISNTATAAIMLPLVLGMLQQLDASEQRSTWIFALLGVAYCANIGGIATLVGSPPNAIAAAQTGLSFAAWMQKALPITLLLLPAAVLTLYWVLKPSLNHRVSIHSDPIEWNGAQKYTLAIFLLAVIGWVFSEPINAALGNLASFDSLVAVAAILALAITGAVQWQDIEKTTDWGVLILFGGGLCLSAVLKATGTSLFLGQTIGNFIATLGPFLALVVIVSFVVFLTEFASNTASAALLIPIFIAIAPNVGLDPITIAALIAIAASCAFMLPVATPPNALVFGTGYVPQKSMMKVGLWINLVCILILSLYASLFW